MPKLPAHKARSQKVLRLDDDVEQTKVSDGEPAVANTNLDAQDTIMTRLLVNAIFGDRPLKRQISAVGYIISLRSQAPPKPTLDGFQTYMRSVGRHSPTSLRKEWDRMEQFFSDDNADFSSFENFLDVASLATAFKETTSFATTGTAPSTSTIISPPPQPPTPPVASYNAPSSGVRSNSLRSSSISNNDSNSSGSTSESSNSRGKVTPGQIFAMRNLFKQNFDKFGGNGWLLPSGAVVDDRLRGVVEALPCESALHSFIVEDVDTVLGLFDDAQDREAIVNTMVTRKDERLPGLSSEELSLLQQYNQAPEDLHEFLLSHSCRSVGDSLGQEKPSDEFQIAAHDAVTQVLRNYQSYPLFDYRPGEISSESSARRRRKDQYWDSRQFMGHKVDGVVVISKRPLEICWVEAAKKDGGGNTSKCLHDTKKLLKLMEDGHDMIRGKAGQDIRQQLVTYALRISGPSISILTLRQRPGRFYQATEEETISFPLTWFNKEDTTQVLAVIARILKLRNAIKGMAASIST
ncbi:hypothetical protein EC968_003911 [Mortierella alpina]|nr:hypothetical protein EC968_003911 [Mortierella alpina]